MEILFSVLSNVLVKGRTLSLKRPLIDWTSKHELRQLLGQTRQRSFQLLVNLGMNSPKIVFEEKNTANKST